jgi:hypothetical protein
MIQPASTPKRIGTVAAAVAVLGCMMPWVNAPLVSRSGIDTSDGKVLAVLAIIAFVVGLLTSSARRIGAVYLVCGGLGAAVAFHDLNRLGDVRRGVMRAIVTPGLGLYLVVGAFVALAIAGIASIAHKK